MFHPFFFLGHSSGHLGAGWQKEVGCLFGSSGPEAAGGFGPGPPRAAGGVLGHSAAFDTAPPFAYNANCSIFNHFPGCLIGPGHLQGGTSPWTRTAFLSRIAPYAACCIVSALVFLILGWAAAKKGRAPARLALRPGQPAGRAGQSGGRHRGTAAGPGGRCG